MGHNHYVGEMVKWFQAYNLSVEGFFFSFKKHFLKFLNIFQKSNVVNKYEYLDYNPKTIKIHQIHQIILFFLIFLMKRMTKY